MKILKSIAAILWKLDLVKLSICFYEMLTRVINLLPKIATVQDYNLRKHNNCVQQCTCTVIYDVIFRQQLQQFTPCTLSLVALSTVKFRKGATIQFFEILQRQFFHRYALKEKKRYYLGIFPKHRTPPPTPPFWEPLIQKRQL